jgi:NAD(P)-dependent dehydrogenase (short-subunit alcohol dehydrogenase family)
MEGIGVNDRQKVLVVGGMSGIGDTVARELKRQYPKLEQYVPPRLIMDVTDRCSVANAVQAEGPFTHIVYSAGMNDLAWVPERRTARLMDETFRVNCSGFVSVVSEHIHAFPDDALSVVAVSSDAAEIPMRGSVAYCASKAALNMAVKVLARELAPLHRINAVSPGMVDGTPMTAYIDATIPIFRGWTPDQARNYERQNVPTERRASRDEVAETVIWVLMGPDQMTGSIIDINGGRS